MNDSYGISHWSYDGKQFVLKLSNGYGMLNLIVKLIPFHVFSKAVGPSNILVKLLVASDSS